MHRSPIVVYFHLLGYTPYQVATLFLFYEFFGIVVALNSALHSYLILAYAGHDKVAMNVGFYYMANAAGRLLGTLLSGALYQYAGLTACLWMAALLTGVAVLASLNLPAPESVKKSAQADRPADALLKR